ncbi:MAG: hypothetical protein WCF65_06555 [Parachlamydiaceae bacterium]
MKAHICSKDITLQLREAIDRLAAYVSKRNNIFFPSVSQTFASMQTLLSPLGLEQREFKTQYPHDKVSLAVEFILRQRFFIEKLKQGTQEEQELAASLTQTIKAYNQRRDERIHRKGMGIIGFFSIERDAGKGAVPPKVTFSPNTTVKHYYPENTAPDTVCNTLINTTKTSAPIVLPIQSIELFQMKVISLIESYAKTYGITLNSDIRALIKNTPISANAQKDADTCTWTQTLNLFPGHTIIVMGDSALDPKTRSIGTLFPKTFRLSEELTQTGFPHPSQRAGWTLAYELIPGHPQRVDLLDQTADLFFRKARVIENMLSQGNFLKSAKALLAQKKQSFQVHREELLKLHRQLAFAILHAAPQSIVPKNAEVIVTRFYDILLTHPSSYDLLSKTHQTIINHFIIQPHHTLIEAILKGKATDFGSRHPTDRYHASQQLLDEAVTQACTAVADQSETAKLPVNLDYIECFGTILGTASKNIILQYLSEDLIFQPPSLTSFESKVQAAAYRHLSDFLNEIENSPSDILELMRNEISADIALFDGNETPAVSIELSHYFQSRYASLKS